MALEGVAGCVVDGDAPRAAMLLAAAETIRGAPVAGVGADRAYVDSVIGRARASLGARLYDEAVDAGRRLATTDAVELALGARATAPN
jgi:hypothetical protein